MLGEVGLVAIEDAQLYLPDGLKPVGLNVSEHGFGHSAHVAVLAEQVGELVMEDACRFIVFVHEHFGQPSFTLGQEEFVEVHRVEVEHIYFSYGEGYARV